VGRGGGGTREIKKILARPRQPLPTLFTDFPRRQPMPEAQCENTSSRILRE
jgi:hypothetical protein